MANFYVPTKRQPTKQKLTVEVHALDAFGQGVAAHSGKTIFIKNALPGETVDIQLTEDKKQFAKARVLKRYNDSPERVIPRCPHYDECGGCQMQHVAEKLQQQSKQAALLNLMSRETKQDIASEQCSVVAAGEYGYRRRARLAVMWQKGKLQMGFRQELSSDIINIQTCPVLVKPLDDLLIPLRTCLNQLKSKQVIGHVELLSVESGLIIVLRHTQPLVESDYLSLIQFAQKYQLSLYLHGTELVCVTEDKTPYYQIDDLALTFSPLDFIQVNGQINQKMVEQALSWLELSSNDEVLDLFCGMGNFSLPMAKVAKQVIGVEGVDALVEKAQTNTILNKDLLDSACHIEFYQQNLDELPKHPVWLKNSINKVLLDPARVGALTVITQIATKDLSHIVYISCNPATLARDSKILTEQGYKLVKLSVLDMFPQTKHLESMALFMR